MWPFFPPHYFIRQLSIAHWRVKRDMRESRDMREKQLPEHRRGKHAVPVPLFALVSLIPHVPLASRFTDYFARLRI
jgi:hypothetical protein